MAIGSRWVFAGGGWLILACVAGLSAVTCNGQETIVGPPASPGIRTALPPLEIGAAAFVGVNVVPMDTEGVLTDRTVVVRDGRIEAIGPRGETDVPDDAERIDAGGRFLLPGLIDMHVHLSRADIDAYLDAGITTVRNMWGTEAVEQLRAEAAEGALVPTIFSAGPGLDGTPPYWPGTVVVEDAEAAAVAVERQAADGWDFIKVYNNLEPEPYDAIIERARALGITVVGHTPRPVGLNRSLTAGQASVEHMSGFEVVLGDRVGFPGWMAMDPDRLEPLVDRIVERGTWICPTLSIVAKLTRRLDPDDRATLLENRRRVVRALHEAGVPLLAGSDAGINVVPPGITLAEELERLANAGLGAYAALHAATVGAARFLAVEDEIGAVAVGKRADLVLVEANPLNDIRNIRGPIGVMLRGRWIPLDGAPAQHAN